METTAKKYSVYVRSNKNATDYKLHTSNLSENGAAAIMNQYGVLAKMVRTDNKPADFVPIFGERNGKAI